MANHPICPATMKRFVIILLALLSGLSVPQAVAAASGRSDTSVVAVESVALAAPHQIAGLQRSARRSGDCCAARRPVWLPLVALAGGAAVHFGDRARE